MKPTLPPPRMLANGSRAWFESDPYIDRAVQLVIDGAPQSHLILDRPAELHFEYVRRIGYVIDLFKPANEPITALHLGGGAFTLPRYVEATRPGSRQQVIEIDGELVDYVRESFPLPQRANIRVRRGDARERMQKLPKGLHGNVDLIVVDVFSGSHTPAHLTTREFFSLTKPLLSRDGIVAVNAADGAGQGFVRSQIATLREIFPVVAALSEPQVFKGRRFGNVVLLASTAESSATTGLEWLPRLLARGPHPGRMLSGAELASFVRGAAPITDATAVASPTPPQHLFETR